MCGRFSLDSANPEIAGYLEKLPPEILVKTGEVYPTDTCLVLIPGAGGNPEASAMDWGFPHWRGRGVIINARCETALHKPFFAHGLMNAPLVVPTTGFYEWRQEPGKARKDKFLFREPGSDVLYLAAFARDFPKEDTGWRFCILTTNAEGEMAAYHDRMPVLLKKSEIPGWLDGSNRHEIMSREPFAVVAVKAG